MWQPFTVISDECVHTNNIWMHTFRHKQNTKPISGSHTEGVKIFWSRYEWRWTICHTIKRKMKSMSRQVLLDWSLNVVPLYVVSNMKVWETVCYGWTRGPITKDEARAGSVQTGRTPASFRACLCAFSHCLSPAELPEIGAWLQAEA